MLVDGTVEAPSSEILFGPLSRPLRRPLAPDQLLEVDPLLLRLRQQSSACLGTKVPNDDTEKKRGQSAQLYKKKNAHIKANNEWECGDSPDEERENDNGTEQVVDEEKNGVDERRVGLRLLVKARDARHGVHDVNPSFERDNLKEDEKRRVERVE